jgi:ribokinase
MSVVVIGSVNRDYMCRVSTIPREGETVMASEIQLGNGGKGGNQAVACAKLGVPTRLVSCVGRDPYGERLLADLAAEGVDTTSVCILDESWTALAFVMVADDGENSIVVAPGANQHMDPEVAGATVAKLLGPEDVLVAQTEIPPACVEAAIDQAQLIGARVVLNLAPYVPVADDTLRACDPLVVNEGEARDLLGITDASGVDPFEMATRLGSRAKSVVITLGGFGALVAHGGDLEHVPAETVTVVDSTGAGDAFTGALAAALSQGDDLLAAVQHGVAAGTFAVTHPGAQASYPTAEELAEFKG